MEQFWHATGDVIARPLEYVPIGHCWQATDDVMAKPLEYVPEEQFWHVEEFVAPTLVE